MSLLANLDLNRSAIEQSHTIQSRVAAVGFDWQQAKKRLKLDQ